MDSGEIFLLLVLLAWLGSLAVHFFGRLFEAAPLTCPPRPRLILAAIFAFALAVHWVVAVGFAPANVRTEPGIQALFVVAHALLALAATHAMAALGLSAIEDGIERNNEAARIAIGAVWLALGICATGAELGEGDSVVTFFAPLVMSALALLALAAAFSAGSRAFAAITQERDRAAGIRFAGLALGWSLPLAQAAHGDWVSLAATAIDFARELPLLLAMLALALVVERRSPTPRYSWVAAGCLVALGAVAWRWRP